MKRALVLSTLLSFCVVSLGSATVTRVKTMGRVNQFVSDDANIFLYPSTVVKFSDRFFWEVGDNADPWVGVRDFSGIGGGAFYALNDIHHLGFFVNANDRVNGEGISDPFFPGDLSLDDFIGLFYGYGADKFDIGAEVDFAKSRNETTAPSDAAGKESVGRVGFSGGVTYRMEDDNALDVAFLFNKTSITDDFAKLEADGFNTVGVRGRLFWNYNDELQFVPAVDFVRANRGVKTETTSSASDSTRLDFGLGLNVFPNDKVQLVTVGGVRIASVDVSNQDGDVSKSKSKFLPFVKGGFDAKIKSWINFRAGVEKQLVSAEATDLLADPDRTGQATSADFQSYLGTGLHFGDLTIDTQVDPNFFFRGPNFVSGGIADLNTRVSIVYPW